MSALPPIADIRRCRWDVRKVPKADIWFRRELPCAAARPVRISLAGILCGYCAYPRVSMPQRTEVHRVGEMNLAPQAEIIGIGQGRSLAQMRGVRSVLRSGYGLGPR